MIGKKFIVCGRRAMYNKMVLYQKPTFYEIITEQPTSLYLDIDLSLHPDELSLDFEEVDLIVTYIKQKLIHHLDISFDQVCHEFNYQENLIIMHSCSSLKMSLHTLHIRKVFQL